MAKHGLDVRGAEVPTFTDPTVRKTFPKRSRNCRLDESMSNARQIVSLLKSHIEGDDRQFLAIAMQLAAHEARLGHVKLAQELRELIDDAKKNLSVVDRPKGISALPLAQPRGELANLLSLSYPETRLSDMVLPSELQRRLKRVLLEQSERQKLLSKNLSPRRTLLLLGPPGSGKTMTASALAGELRLPMFTILLEGLITKFLGETAAKLRVIFDAMARTRGVYLFDEFDALGTRRTATNDVGEIRRILNSFLQFLENDSSDSVIVAATNHAELLDRALFRRFDDVIEYGLPDASQIQRIFKTRLASFSVERVQWKSVVESALGLSRADIVRASADAAKMSVLDGLSSITEPLLLQAISERKMLST